MRRGTLRGGYVLEEEKHLVIHLLQVKKQSKNKTKKINASIDVSHSFLEGLDKNAQGKVLAVELIFVFYTDRIFVKMLSDVLESISE